MSAGPATAPRALALLDHAVSYTRRSLAAVTEDRLDAPTPCSAWDLQALLRHMDDSLAAFTEAAELGQVRLSPCAPQASAEALARRVRERACALLDAWHETPRPHAVSIGAGALPADAVAGVGALEITVHGWDVARSLGLPHPIPDELAAALTPVAITVVGEPDRPDRFAAALPTESTDTADRLLAFLGR